LFQVSIVKGKRKVGEEEEKLRGLNYLLKLEPSASNELHAFIGPSLGQSCTVEFSLFYEVKCQQVHRRIFISSKKIKSK
jgi:hypothetical protein